MIHFIAASTSKHILIYLQDIIPFLQRIYNLVELSVIEIGYWRVQENLTVAGMFDPKC